MNFTVEVILRCVMAVVIGMIIGSERARHGRAAGMRTHILVSLGAALTSMISIYAKQYLGYDGDILRLSAQVISGVGFLGAGMIILKNNNIITGLTTAAGVWTTSVIGIAVGCGFYSGSVVVTLLYMIALILLGRLERHKKQSDIVYIEIDDMYAANDTIHKIKESEIDFSFHFVPPKSGYQGNLGISLLIENRKNFDIYKLKNNSNIVFIEEE